MNIKTRYTFTMEEYDEDSEECETVCIVERTLHDPCLDDLAEAFKAFLWNATFNYVEDVTVVRTSLEDVN
jgi:hypothetical protein